MLSELLKLLDRLQGELFLYLEDGQLKSRLVESYMENEDALVEFLEFDHNASLRIKPKHESTPPVFYCRLETSDFNYQVLLSAEDFTSAEIAELITLLLPFCQINPKQEPTLSRKIIRKKKGSNLLGIAAAAKALGLSHRLLKALIPCSETRIVEKDGAKRIEEYYWDKELIDRFEMLWVKQQEGRGYNREDLTIIATACCDGDQRWARDCIVGFLNQRKLGESYLQG